MYIAYYGLFHSPLVKIKKNPQFCRKNLYKQEIMRKVNEKEFNLIKKAIINLKAYTYSKSP